MRITFSRKLGRELIARFNYGAAFDFAMVAAGLATVVHLVWFLTSFAALDRRIAAAKMVIIDWDPSILMMQIRIGLVLLVSVAALWSRRVVGLFLSALAFAWAIAEYIAWRAWSIRIKANAGIEVLPGRVANALNLYGATPWNALVLVLVIIVFLWEIGWLIRIVKSRPTQ